MSLFKRGNVWWAYLYRDGIRYEQSTGTSNRKKAEKIEAKLREEVNDQRFQIVEADPHMTFGELAARFLASGSVRPHHVYHLKFLLPYFMDIPAMRITKSLTEEFRKARRNHNPSIKDAAVNRDLSVLRHLFYWAADEQLLCSNPLARQKMARERRTKRQVLSVDEEDLLLNAASGHLRAMILAALDTGMRRGEITGQRWEDIDFPRKVLFVTRSKTPEGESREIPLDNASLSNMRSNHEKRAGEPILHPLRCSDDPALAARKKPCGSGFSITANHLEQRTCGASCATHVWPGMPDATFSADTVVLTYAVERSRTKESMV